MDELPPLPTGSDDKDLDVVAADLGRLVHHLGQLAGAAGVQKHHQDLPRRHSVAVPGGKAGNPDALEDAGDPRLLRPDDAPHVFAERQGAGHRRGRLLHAGGRSDSAHGDISGHGVEGGGDAVEGGGDLGGDDASQHVGVVSEEDVRVLHAALCKL